MSTDVKDKPKIKKEKKDKVKKSGISKFSTYRALTTLFVGEPFNEYREPGDFIPEAETWKNRKSYLDGHKIETYYASQDEMEAWEEKMSLRRAITKADKEAEANQEIEEGLPDVVEEDIKLPSAPRVVKLKKKKVVK